MTGRGSSSSNRSAPPPTPPVWPLHWDDTTREVDVSTLALGRLSMILPGSGRASRGVRGDEPAPGTGWWASAGGRSAPASRTDAVAVARPRRRPAATTR